MLSDLLTFVLALAVCGMAALCVYCYRLGLRDGGFAQRNGGARRRLPLRNGGGGEKESVSERGFCTAERGRTGAGRPRHGGPRDGEDVYKRQVSMQMPSSAATSRLGRPCSVTIRTAPALKASS